MSEAREVDFDFFGEILRVKTGDPEWCAALIATANQIASWTPATVINSGSAPHYSNDRNNDAQTVSGLVHPDWSPFEARLNVLFGQCAGLYRGLNKYVDVQAHTGFQLLRYEPGQHFREHVDNIARHETWGQRQLSVVLYLNEGFDGGETYFPRQKRVVQPRTGDLIVFPSHFTHPHSSADVETGTKYSLVSWYV